MTSLYSLRSTPAQGEYTILKLSEDYDVESIYALSHSTCTCPAGHRPKCKHRRMLPLFLQHSHVDDGWFLDWDTRLWRHPIAETEIEAERKLADTTVLGNADQAEAIAARLAPALASEASNLALQGAPSTNSQLPPIPGSPLASPAEATADAPAPALASAAMGVEGRAEPPAAAGGLRRRRI